MKGKKLFANFKENAIILAAIVISAYYITSKVDPTRMDADLIVQSLASLKYLTLFYWSQDRLASLVPLVISPIRNISENLYANVFTQAFLFSCLIFYIIKTISAETTLTPSENKKLDAGKFLFAIPCYFSAIALISYLTPEYELFWFTKHAQPYAGSTLLMLCAYNLYKASHKVEGKNNKKISIVILLLISSLILNPLSLFLGGSLWIASLFQAFFSLKRKAKLKEYFDALWVMLLIISSLCYLTINRLYLENYSLEHTTLTFRTSYIFKSLKEITPKLINSFGEYRVGLVTITLICIYVFSKHALLLLDNRTTAKFEANLGYDDKHFTTIFNARFGLGIAIYLNLLSLIPILSSEHLALNLYSLRYLFPLYLVIFYSIAYFSADVFKAVERLALHAGISSITAGHKQTLDLISILITSLCLSIFLGNSRPISPNLLVYREVSVVEPAYKYLVQKNLLDSYLGGSYWVSWPLKAIALSKGFDMAVITDRSKFDPISHQSELRLANDLRHSSQIQYHCIAISEDDLLSCKKYLHDLIKESWPSPRKPEITSTKLFSSNLNEQVSIYRISTTDQQYANKKHAKI